MCINIYYWTGNFIQRMAWLPLRILFYIFFNLEIRGISHVKKINKNAIFACNHVSEIDPLVVVSSLPFFSKFIPLIFVSREKEYYKKIGWRGRMYGGFLFKIMGAFPAYINLKDYSKSLAHHLHAISLGYNVCIFPVGKHHGDNEFDKAKGGVTYLSHLSNVPIIPVRISKIKKNGNPNRAKKIMIVTFGEPIFVQIKNETDFNDKSFYKNSAIEIMKRVLSL